MPAIVYPTGLPVPQRWELLHRERAVRSAMPGPAAARARSRGLVVDVTGAAWLYKAAELAIWRAWFRDVLLDGQLWFEMPAPGTGGELPRVMRYRPNSVRMVPLGHGLVRVSAELEVRERSASPQMPEAGGGETSLFWARFEAADNRDEVGRWIYVLDEFVDPGDTFLIDATTGAPGSTAGSINKDDAGGRRFYIQHADNETGGSSNLADAGDFNLWNWTYSIWFRVPSTSPTDINLGGFNPGGGNGQTIFSLDYYHFGGSPEIEARIGAQEGAFYLNGGVLTVPADTWHRVRIRRTEGLIELLFNDDVVASDTRSFSYAATGLFAFGIDKHYSGTRRGWFDEPRLTYTVA